MDKLAVNPLYFPSFKYIGRAELMQEDEEEDGELIQLPAYRLEWDVVDKPLQLEHESWMEINLPQVDPFFSTWLSPKWEDWLKRLVFTIRPEVMAEVKRCVRMAQMERERYLPFDDEIKEYCAQTVHAFMDITFQLLATTVYDPNLQFFSLEPDALLVAPALRYRFWANQAPPATIPILARLSEVRLKAAHLGEEHEKLVEVFLHDLKGVRKHQMSLIQQVQSYLRSE